MAFQPLTREQYQKALNAGFTPDQILINEKKRKALETPPMPISSKESSNFGENLVTAGKDVAVGAGKGLLSGLQDLGKSALGLLGTYQGGEQSRPGARNTGTFKPLVDTSRLGIKEETLKAQNRGEQVGKVLEFGAELGTGFVAAKGPQAVVKAKQAYTASKEAKAGEKVLEMISPKATVGQAKLAQAEGRLVEGKPATFFRSGTEGSILPTKKTLSARDLIVEKIPNASKLKPTELYNAVDTEITKTAQKLKPQMQATPIKPETVQKINDDWTKLKKTQVELADATEEANVIKLQNQFEERLMKSGNQSYDDLWETRKAYDDSIPDNVKRANDFSAPSLQTKKEIWLQNRDILNKAMDDVAGESFKEMSNLYEAKTGLLSKAKVDKAQISKLKQLMKDNPALTGVLGGLLGGTTVYSGLKKLGVPLP